MSRFHIIRDSLLSRSAKNIKISNIKWLFKFISRMSGISPFAGENNQETCSNVTKADWDFEDKAFETISPEAKDFISKLVIRNQR